MLSPAVLAIDIGATTIKMADVASTGVPVGAVRRRSTPYPCTPDRLLTWLSDRIERRGIDRVGVGFPGETSEGIIVAPGNLSRPNGITSAVDENIDQQWRGFPLQQALCQRTGRDVRVVNDAALAALGSTTGAGRELVLTLGTGFGVALVVDGVLQKIPDYGRRTLLSGPTFDEALGERARATDATRWQRSLREAISVLSSEWETPTVHLGGGNSQRLKAGHFATKQVRVSIHGNRAPLRGAARLFEGWLTTPSMD